MVLVGISFGSVENSEAHAIPEYFSDLKLIITGEEKMHKGFNSKESLIGLTINIESLISCNKSS